METRRLGEQFEELVSRIFSLQGFLVEKPPARSEQGADLIIVTDKSRAAVEVKLWRSSTVSTAQILVMCQQVDRYRAQSGIPYAIVVISAVLNPGKKAEANSRFPQVRVYDLNTLAFLADADEKLAGDFSAFVSEALAFSSEINLFPERPAFGDIEPRELQRRQPRGEPRPGQRLCDALREVRAGRENARRFEQGCVAALKYVFEDDLTGWQEQRRTESGMSIYDTVCRVVPRHDLWKMIIDQFNSRYVIFEFKNYNARIKQGQVYTTEKYLYRPALRAVAILVSRRGPDPNARKACSGALRELGKLVLNLTVDDVCEMLHAKDAQDDPNSLLMSKLDDMLMLLER